MTFFSPSSLSCLPYLRALGPVRLSLSLTCTHAPPHPYEMCIYRGESTCRAFKPVTLAPQRLVLLLLFQGGFARGMRARYDGNAAALFSVFRGGCRNQVSRGTKYDQGGFFFFSFPLF